MKNNINKSDCKVLLVEDEPLVQKMHLLMLNALNCEVTLAENGQIALDYAVSHYYDIILMDIGLPDIKGNDVAKTIRENLKFKSNSSYIVALTAFIEDRIKSTCMAAGMNVVESKPISSDRLKQLCLEAKQK